MVETGKNKSFEELFDLSQKSLSRIESGREEVIDSMRKVVKDKFEHIQELRQKLKIENEKQKLLIRVLENMKESKKAENLQSCIEEKEIEFLKKQTDILNKHLSVKKDELALKKALLSEKNTILMELQEKLSMLEETPTENPEVLTVHPKPFKPATSKTIISKESKKLSLKVESDDFFSEFLSK
jgi:hypothetical protein